MTYSLLDENYKRGLQNIYTNERLLRHLIFVNQYYEYWTTNPNENNDQAIDLNEDNDGFLNLDDYIGKWREFCYLLYSERKKKFEENQDDFDLKFKMNNNKYRFEFKPSEYQAGNCILYMIKDSLALAHKYEDILNDNDNEFPQEYLFVFSCMEIFRHLVPENQPCIYKDMPIAALIILDSQFENGRLCCKLFKGLRIVEQPRQKHQLELMRNKYFQNDDQQYEEYEEYFWSRNQFFVDNYRNGMLTNKEWREKDTHWYNNRLERLRLQVVP